MSIFSSFPSWVMDFVANNLELFLGYAICVVFPIPWLNRFILDGWAKLLSKQSTTPTN